MRAPAPACQPTFPLCEAEASRIPRQLSTLPNALHCHRLRSTSSARLALEPEKEPDFEVRFPCSYLSIDGIRR